MPNPITEKRLKAPIPPGVQCKTMSTSFYHPLALFATLKSYANRPSS